MSSNNNSEMLTTPNKRKRESAKQLPNDKENNFTYNGLMEIKSIGDLIPTSTSVSADNNQYEILRKPPKKKKKNNANDVNCCFVNEALNLNGPENPLNPFEIRRASSIGIPCASGFINSGLNIREPEKNSFNPFEIVRQPTVTSLGVPAASTPNSNGIENSALELQPTPRAIRIPFTPTIGCRINFNDVPLESLTPCSMLAKTLVFTPEPKSASNSTTTTTPKRTQHQHLTNKKPTGLSMITEESVDIEEELNCYQLELENSINEAKSNEKKSNNKNLMELKHKSNFAERLKNSQYNELVTETDDVMKPQKSTTNFVDRIKNLQYNQLETDEVEESSNLNEDNSASNLKPKIVEVIVRKCTTPAENVKYDQFTSDEEHDDSSSETEFKSPAPFVRTYRRSMRNNNLTKPTDSDLATKEAQKSTGNGIRHSIRKSIKKLMSSNHQLPAMTKENNSQSATNLFSTLRQSLRKKVVNKSKSSESLLYNSNHDVSIMIDTNRQVFRQLSPNRINAKVVSDAAVLGKKSSMLRGSFRNTKRHVMKSVFKKNVEDYCLD